jgi:hypothetical protein
MMAETPGGWLQGIAMSALSPRITAGWRSGPASGGQGEVLLAFPGLCRNPHGAGPAGPDDGLEQEVVGFEVLIEERADSPAAIVLGTFLPQLGPEVHSRHLADPFLAALQNIDRAGLHVNMTILSQRIRLTKGQRD